MGKTKTEVFTDTENELAVFAKALAHPARIAILGVLLRRNSCICGDIVDELPLSQSTVSQHLKELREAGLIQGEISGPRICYCINIENWKKVDALLKTFFAQLNSNDKKCC
ncbi:MAG: ArsR/SmtB family transcription factor [Bacteroidota bacterium]|jgi:DNA-binding transcriptional ArsR family regulator